MTGQPSG